VNWSCIHPCLAVSIWLYIDCERSLHPCVYICVCAAVGSAFPLPWWESIRAGEPRQGIWDAGTHDPWRRSLPGTYICIAHLVLPCDY
jgi:hypothetical protein